MSVTRVAHTLMTSVMMSAMVTCLLSEGITCPAKDGLDEFHAEIPGPEENHLFPANQIVQCTCHFGYTYHDNCKARCTEGGTWEMVTPCRPIECRGPPGISQAFVQLKDKYILDELANYICNEHFVMIGNGSMKCSPDHYLGQTGRWTPVGGIRPACVLDADCGTPPNVTNGILVSVNLTREYGQAEYACADDSLMIGDGVARCLMTSVTSVYSTTVRYVDWLYIPRCDRKCNIPDGAHGTQPKARIQITKCVTNSFSPFLEQTCENPVIVNMKKGAKVNGQSMMFYGDEICGAITVIKIKYAKHVDSRSREIHTPGSPSQECAEFCMSGRHGYHEIVVKETLSFDDSGEASFAKITYILEAQDME